MLNIWMVLIKIVNLTNSCILSNSNLYSNSTGNHNSRSKSKKQLNKSASSADHLDKTGGFETSVAPPVALGRRGFSLERPLENIEKKKSASESNLLAAATSSNDIAPTTADTGHSVAFIQKFVSKSLCSGFFHACFK